MTAHPSDREAAFGLYQPPRAPELIYLRSDIFEKKTRTTPAKVIASSMDRLRQYDEVAKG